MAIITGTSGNDSLTGTASDDFLDGLSGDDTLDGGDGNDTLLGGDGGDLLFQSRGNDSIDGGADFDRLSFTSIGIAYGGSLGVSVNLATGVSNASGGHIATISSIELIIGTAGDDTFVGGDPAHLVGDSFGGTIQESFRPLAGNDTITGGNPLDGFATHVEYSTNTSVQPVTVNLGTGLANDGLGGTDTLINVHRAVGGAGDDVLIGGGLGRAGLSGIFFEQFRGNAGNDTLDGGDGFHGGAMGGDRAEYQNSPGSVIANLGTASIVVGSDTVLGGTARDGFGFTDTLIDISQVFGGSAADTLVGGAKDDVLHGGPSSDHIDGGAGNDQVRYQLDTSGVIVNLSTGNLVVGAVIVAGGTALDGSGSTDTLVNIEQAAGSDFNDYLRGSDDPGVVQIFDGRAGNDTIDGGAGIDFASWSTYPFTRVGVNLFIENGGGTVSDGYGGVDTLISIEGLQGSNSNDTLAGGAGDQWFRGRGRSDTINGGAGNDWVSYSPDPSGVTVNLATGTAIDGWDGPGGLLALGGTDTLISIENVEGSPFDDVIVGDENANQLDGGDGNDSLSGLGGNDTLIGGAGNDTLDGGTGVDSMAGGTGDDTFIVDNVLDIVVEAADEGTDTVITSVGIVLPDHVENLQFVGNGGVITGNAEDNVIAGSPFDDTLIGGGGNDTISYEYETNPVTIDLFTGIATGSGTDTLQGFQNARGGAAPDVLIGNDNANVLDGRGNVDTLQGGRGNDTYVVDHAADVIFEVANEVSLGLSLAPDTGLEQAVLDGFIDTVIAAIDYSLANVSFVENLTLNPDSTATTGIGNELDNALTGNALNNTLTGLAGNDTLTGGGGNDTLDGGASIDTAIYSSNRSAYTVSPAGASVSGPDGSDTLSSIERLQFSDKNLAFDLNAGQAAGNTVRIIGAAFDANNIIPEFVGIGISLFESGMSLLQVSELALGTNLYLQLAGSRSNVDFVNLVFENVVGVPPSQEERDFFVGLLQGSGGTMTQAELLVLATNAVVNEQNINLVGLQQSGVEFV